ncbi:MAG: NAD(P)H-binding protein [Candidatus Manganitrophaceae bacterium]
MYVITGATGNTGKVIAEKLLTQGKKVRVIGRSDARLKSLVAQGAEGFVGDVEEAGAMTRAFTGAQAVYMLIPPNYTGENMRGYQNRVGEVYAEATVNARVPYIVNLSSVGAHLSEKAGPINGLHDHEQRLNKLNGVHILHLRPTSFMENLFGNIGLIKKMGIHGTPLRGDLSITMIATKDIAAEAAERLLRLDFSGKSVKELLGERDLTMAEVTRILGKAIGKPELPYVQFPYDDAEKAIIGIGFSADVARNFIEMYRSMNEGVIRPTEKRSAKNTTPTSIEQFAVIFAAAYNG